MADIALAFVWHQHQPYYPDDVAGTNPMPWVRLHGVKDYFGMAALLREFPEVRCTINLTPCLLKQIVDYTNHGATDEFLRADRIPAADLSATEAEYLVNTHFLAHQQHMIGPHPRYAELLQRRGVGASCDAKALHRFDAADLRDLQVWFNLIWIHPLLFELDANLRELRNKGTNFTEEEKNWLLDRHIEILSEIIPLHRALQDTGQVELTTTPYYHPILPLLLDKKFALEAMPHARLPRATEGYPEDAEIHIRRAIEQHARLFGRAPGGMWPAEGSVCQSMLPLLHRHGIRWIATDEGVLTASSPGAAERDTHGVLRRPAELYRPYRIGEQPHELSIVFRDHMFSDRIGFDSQRQEPTAAAQDFVDRVRTVGDSINGTETVLVSVILDGENCWEHYPGNGVAFRRALFDLCRRTPGIRTVSVGRFLEDHPAVASLPHLAAGSWINHNFRIWIGHEEDNTAWDLLHQAREFLRRSEAAKSDDQLRRAWEEIHIAEGSDWFWWYGDDHTCPQVHVFDDLFRRHLRNVYHILGESPSAELSRPIKRS